MNTYLYKNIINTLIVFFVLLIAYLIINAISAKKNKGERDRRNFKIRLLYITFIIFIFFIARIWVEGFSHIVTMLGIVSAALVITNKETIMNLTGFFIITWRELFIENDLIQLLQYKGYVKSIGLLYFTLSEVSEGIHGDVTGRIIRVPNGLASTNALINFSQTSHLLEQHFSVIVTPDSDIDTAIDFVGNIVAATINEKYKAKREYSVEYLCKRNKHIISRINLKPKTSINLKQSKPSGIEIISRYHCFSEDAEKLHQQICLNLIKAQKDQSDFKLSYDL